MSAPSASAQRRGESAARRENTKPTVVLVIVLAAVFMQLLDVSIVNVASPDIQRTLHSSYADVQLVLSGYQIGFASTLITAARLGDIHGRRKMFLIGMVLFTAASVFCGTATNIHVLVVSRVFQGLSSALMFSQVLAIIQVVIPRERQAKAFGAYGAAIGLGSIMGPIAGGALIQAAIFSDPWRSIFLVNVPIGVAAIALALKYMPESTAPDKPRLDIPGVLLSSAGLGLVIYPLSEGRTHGWPLWIYAMLVSGLLLLALFVAYEIRRTKANRFPVLDTSLFGDRAFRIGAMLNTLFFLGIPSFFFSFNIYLQAGMGFSALGAGMSAFPYALGAAVASPLSDKFARKLGRSVLALGAGLLTLGTAGVIATVHLMGTHPHAYSLFPAMLVCGVGFGFFVPPVTGIVLANVARQRAGAASGSLATAQQIGGATGVALIGIIFFGFVGHNAPGGAAKVHAAIPAAERAHFDQCFVTRAKAKDPTITPAGCAAPAGTPADVVADTATIAAKAQAHTFVKTVQESLLFEVLAFGLCTVLVVRLPKASGSTGHAEPNLAAG